MTTDDRPTNDASQDGPGGPGGAAVGGRGDGGPAANWRWDAARLRIIEADAATAALFGAPDAASLLSWSFPPGDPMVKALAAAADGGPAGEIAFALLREDDALWVRARAARVASEAGAPIVAVTEARAAAPDPIADAPSRAVADVAAAPLALFDADGAPVWRNAAAARLFGDAEPGSFDALFARPELGAALRRVALAEGGARRMAVLSRGVGPREAVARRLRGPGGVDWEIVLTIGPAAGAAAPPRAGPPSFRLTPEEPDSWRAVAVFDEETLTLRAANAAARAALSPAGAQIGRTRLFELFPSDAENLRAALETAARDRAVSLDLSPAIGRPGPWLKAALWRADAVADGAEAEASTVVLAFVDLSAERRSLLRLSVDAEERAAALDAVGLGLAILDPAGAIHRINAAGAERLGDRPAALMGRPLADLIDPAAGRRLASYLADGPVVAGRAFEQGVEVSLRDAPSETLRLVLTPPTRANRTRRAAAFLPVASPTSPAEPAPEPAPERAPEAADAITPSLAHALRSELTTIRGFAELIAEDPAVAASPLPKAYLGDIRAAVDAAVAALASEGAAVDAAPETPEPQPAPPLSDAADASEGPAAAVDLARFAADLVETLAIGVRPDAAPVVQTTSEAAPPARVRDRAALRAFFEAAVDLAPPPETGALRIDVRADGAGGVAVALSGLPSEGPEADLGPRLLAALAGQAGGLAATETADAAAPGRMTVRFEAF